MFYYKVHYWDDYNQEPADENGVLAAADYGEAALKVVDHYGKDNVGTLALSEWEDALCRDGLLEGLDSEQNF